MCLFGLLCPYTALPFFHPLPYVEPFTELCPGPGCVGVQSRAKTRCCLAEFRLYLHVLNAQGTPKKWEGYGGGMKIRFSANRFPLFGIALPPTASPPLMLLLRYILYTTQFALHNT